MIHRILSQQVPFLRVKRSIFALVVTRILLTILMLQVTLAQAKEEDQEVTLRARIKQLVMLRQATLNAVNDQERIKANKEFILFLRDALADPTSFETPFDTIPQLGDLRSGDDFFRMINWNLPLDNQTHRYYCFVQFYDKKQKAYTVVELKQGFRDVQGAERKVFSSDDWYGALYYKIIPSKSGSNRRKRTYMLLGWDGHNQYSAIKVIDVMTITEKNIRFGADIFEWPEKNVKRIVLEYKADASVSLKYDNKRKMIIFNQLVPMQPDLEGLREFYIPMLEFDALVWQKRKWRYVHNVDARQSDDSRIYVDPPLPQNMRR